MSRLNESVLVTGGAGFIGSHTVDLLLARGCRVKVLDNLSSGAKCNLPLHHPNLQLIVGDICCAEAVSEAMEGVDYCLHLAAQVSVHQSIQHSAFSCQQNILGFVQVADAAVQHGIKRLVFASSAAVYGDAKVLPVAETAKPDPTSPYGLEKQVNEQYAALYSRLHQLSCFGVRYFNVYGPRQDPSSPYSGVISIFVSHMQRGKGITIYGDGYQSRDFIYVGDVARANAAALFTRSSGICNVATGHTITLKKLVDILASFSGDVIVEYAPARAGDIHDSSANVTEMQEKLAMSSSVSPEEGLRLLWDAVKQQV